MDLLLLPNIGYADLGYVLSSWLEITKSNESH